MSRTVRPRRSSEGETWADIEWLAAPLGANTGVRLDYNSVHDTWSAAVAVLPARKHGRYRTASGGTPAQALDKLRRMVLSERTARGVS